MRAIVFTGAGGAEVMALEERPDPVPGANEVVVAATHAGLNPADLAQRAGRYPAPPGSVGRRPGARGGRRGGRLRRAGHRLVAGRPRVRRGRRRRAGRRVVVHERHVARVPDRLSGEQAAAVPEAFITAHDAVFTQCGLRMGETLLVNGANGGVGSAGVQLGVAGGARVLANARSDEARERLAAMGADPVALDDVRRRGGCRARAGGRAQPARQPARWSPRRGGS